MDSTDTSIFPDKVTVPTESLLKKKIGPTYNLWQSIRRFTLEHYPNGKEEWYYPGVKYGWNFRIKDKKRAILYLLPRDQYFMAAFVFGEKATKEVLSSDVSDDIKAELKQARAYAEGRGIRINVTNRTILPDIEKLIMIKLRN